jgi:hypothetical protein
MTILSSIQARVFLYRKDSSDQYVSFSTFADIPMCKFNDGLELLPGFDALKNDMKLLAGEIFEICKRTGEAKATNISYSVSVIAAKLPTGEYRGSIQLFDAIDDNIANITISGQIRN